MTEAMSKMGDRKCPNCGAVLKHGESGHFAPPCMGEDGFYVCEKKEPPTPPETEASDE